MTYTFTNTKALRATPVDERNTWRAVTSSPRGDHNALPTLGGGITTRNLTDPTPDSGLQNMRLVVFDKPRTDPETREFSIFDRVRSTEPSRTATLQSIADEIGNSTHAVTVAAVRDAHALWRDAKQADEQESHKDRKRQLKEGLPNACFSGVCAGRNAFVKHSGLLVMDIDHCEGPASLRDRIFRTELSCCLAFISPSGDGVKLVFMHDGGEALHGEAWNRIAGHLRERHEVEVDAQGKDIRRFCYLSHDPDVRLRINGRPFEVTKRPKVALHTPDGHTADGHTPSHRQFTNDEIGAMLQMLPPRPDYDEWIRVIAAVGGALPEDEAVSVLTQWSPEEKEGEYREKLRSRLDQVTLGTLIHMARRHGYVTPVAVRAKWIGVELERAQEVGQAVGNGTVLEMLRKGDRGAAEIFKHARQGEWLYDHGACNWRRYRDGTWDLDEKTGVIEDLQDVVTSVALEAVAAFEHSKKREPLGERERDELEKDLAGLRKLAARVLYIKTAKGVLENTAALDGMGAGGADFDVNPDILVIGNGVVDFNTGGVREFRRQDMATIRSGFTHDPDARCPRFDRFIDEVTCDDPDLARYLMQCITYAQTGYTDADDLPFHHGEGGNGKGVLIGLLERLMGSYFLRVNFDALFGVRSGTPVEYAKAGFRGCRLAVTSEIPSGRKLEEHVVKDLVGGDTMTGRPPYGKPITFRPTHKLWMCGNHRPVIGDTDNGIWRRLKLVPWNASFEGSGETRSELIEEMVAEAGGILNRVLAVWREMAGRRPQAPGTVLDATGDYRTDEDQVRRFIETSLHDKPGNRIATGILHKAYLDWCKGENEVPVALTGRKFVPELRRLRLSIGEGHGGLNYLEGKALPGSGNSVLNFPNRGSAREA